MFRRAMPRFAVVVGLVTLAVAAHANERRFAYTYESATLPTGVRELELWTTNRVGREERYNRFDTRFEYEVGLTDRLLTAFYVNTSASVKDENGKTEKEFEFEGVSSEWKYKLSDAVADPFGSALYGEVTYGPEELELEGKLILDKHVGSMLYATNFVFEYEIGDLGGENESEYAAELDLAGAYFLTPSVSVGLEARAHSEFVRGFEHVAFFAGPNLSWASERAWATLSVLGQVGGVQEDGSFGRDLEEHERVNARLLVGVPF